MNNINQLSQMNMLFYSERCQTCRNLFTILKNENLLGYFKLICVDDKLDRLPPDMVVPMMKLINTTKPLVANETFEWINMMKSIRQQQIMDINKKIIQQNNLNNFNTINKGPNYYDDEIFSGISDKFAFTKIDAPLPHSYFGVNDEDKNVIFTAPEQKNTINKHTQDTLIKNLENQRKDQDNEYYTSMKKKQLESVLNAEQEKFYNNR